MLNILAVLTMILIATAVQGDSVVAKTQRGAPYTTEMHRMLVAGPATASYEEIDPLLMGILAVAAVAFQFRRRYRTSQRAWQRISATTDLAILKPAASTRRSTPPGMRWQQTH